MSIPPRLALHVAVLLFGTAGLFGRWIELPSTTIVLGRVCFAWIALLGILKLRGAGADRGPRSTGDSATPPSELRSVSPLVLAGLGALLALHWVTFFEAIQVSSVAVGLLTFATFPVFTALLEPLLPEEGFDAQALFAGGIALAGIALVVGRSEPDSSTTLGAAWGVASGLTFAVLSLANRRLVARVGALRLALHQDGWAAVALLPVVLLSGGAAPTPRDLILLALLGSVFTAGAHGLFLHALSAVRASRAAVVSTLEPVYGVALAALLLAERPEPRVLVGGAIVIAAAAWVSRPAAPARSPESRPP